MICFRKNWFREFCFWSFDCWRWFDWKKNFFWSFSKIWIRLIRSKNNRPISFAIKIDVFFAEFDRFCAIFCFEKTFAKSKKKKIFALFVRSVDWSITKLRTANQNWNDFCIAIDDWINFWIVAFWMRFFFCWRFFVIWNWIVLICKKFSFLFFVSKKTSFFFVNKLFKFIIAKFSKFHDL